MEEIIIEKCKGVYKIVLVDDNGRSILSKTKDKQIAIEKQEKFEELLEKGILLKSEKSI